MLASADVRQTLERERHLLTASGLQWPCGAVHEGLASRVCVVGTAVFAVGDYGFGAGENSSGPLFLSARIC